MRYTRENKDYTFSRLNPYDPTQPSYNAVGVLDNTTGHYEGSHTDYRAGVEYQWTDNLMTYAQWSTGFRGGGVNPRPFIAAEAVPFGTETVHATEVGVKTDFLDHHSASTRLRSITSMKTSRSSTRHPWSSAV